MGEESERRRGRVRGGRRGKQGGKGKVLRNRVGRSEVRKGVKYE